MGLRKRLPKGRFSWPQSGDAQGKVILSHEELSLLLGGIDLAQTKHKRWYRKASPEGHAPHELLGATFRSTLVNQYPL